MSDRQPIANIEPTCIECGTLAELVTGEVVYPHLPQHHHKPYYRCKCGAHVGCHPGTEIPLGFPAGYKTRRARNDAHAAFDRLWEAKMVREKIPKGRARKAGYKWLAEQLDIEWSDCHISMFNIAMCERVIEVCRPFHGAAR